MSDRIRLHYGQIQRAGLQRLMENGGMQGQLPQLHTVAFDNAAMAWSQPPGGAGLEKLVVGMGGLFCCANRCRNFWARRLL